MKVVALILAFSVLAAAVLLVYSFINLTLVVEPLKVRVLSALEQQSEFERWATALERRAVQGTVFTDRLENDPEAYCFMIYTVSVRNRGLLAAEMAELQVSPVDGDVLCVSRAASLMQNVNEPVIIPARGTHTLQCVLLTRSDAHAVRDLYITYYIWGHPFTVRCTYG